MHKYTVKFGEDEYKRSSEADYTHASYKRGAPFSSPVVFHKSYAAAKRRAGRFGAVKAVEKIR